MRVFLMIIFQTTGNRLSVTSVGFWNCFSDPLFFDFWERYYHTNRSTSPEELVLCQDLVADCLGIFLSWLIHAYNRRDTVQKDTIHIALGIRTDELNWMEKVINIVYSMSMIQKCLLHVQKSLKNRRCLLLNALRR